MVYKNVFYLGVITSTALLLILVTQGTQVNFFLGENGPQDGVETRLITPDDLGYQILWVATDVVRSDTFPIYFDKDQSTSGVFVISVNTSWQWEHQWTMDKKGALWIELPEIPLNGSGEVSVTVNGTFEGTYSVEWRRDVHTAMFPLLSTCMIMAVFLLNSRSIIPPRA